MKRFIFIIFLVTNYVHAQQADVQIDRSIARIAFGSCSKENLPDKQLWDEVNATNPDLWVWLGDNIYGDSEDMDVLRSKYEMQKQHPGYQKLLEQTEVIGIWDDHDFGANDAGKEYPKRSESKEELFRFLDISEDHPARSRAGAYQSYSYVGDALTIKIILLDTRYFRDSLKWQHPGSPKKSALPNLSGDILGSDQWEWLEKQLEDPAADLILLGSGIQVLPTEHRWEKWSNFPKDRSRLLHLLDNSNKPVIILSGDRHISEVSLTHLQNNTYPLWELTSSSLTSPTSNRKKEANSFREKEILYPRNFAVLEVHRKGRELICGVKYVGAENKKLQEHVISFDIK